jgi:ankyrin repeat protein
MRFRRSLLPWIISSCAQTDDIATLKKVQQGQTGVQFNILLPGGSMPLHICAKHNSLKCADFLLSIAKTNEQSIVNETDHVGLTSLFYAILRENEAMIELLVNNGADLKATLTPSDIGMHLCSCAKTNQVNRLRTWHKAGADLDQTDYDGRTALLLVSSYSLP